VAVEAVNSLPDVQKWWEEVTYSSLSRELWNVTVGWPDASGTIIYDDKSSE
jgi:hypothetical protein